MKNARFVLDFGNTNWKSRTDDSASEITIPHAIHEMDEVAWSDVLTRTNGRPPEKYAEINGHYYAFGEEAESRRKMSRRERANKYAEDYFGVGLAYLAARTFKIDRAISVFASYAPGDIDYRENLLAACGNTWQVVIGGEERTIVIADANTFEEPVGGFMNLALTSDGRSYKNPSIKSGRVMVIDIGGGTVSFSGMKGNGELDLSTQFSLPYGFNNVYTTFERALRKRYATEFRTSSSLNPDRVRQAIRDNVFRGGGDEYPCQEEVDLATYQLIKETRDTFDTRCGGKTNWDFIVLTGGGPVPLYDRLVEALDHKQILNAEDDAHMHLANIRGGLKLMYMYENLGFITL